MTIIIQQQYTFLCSSLTVNLLHYLTCHEKLLKPLVAIDAVLPITTFMSRHCRKRIVQLSSSSLYQWAIIGGKVTIVVTLVHAEWLAWVIGPTSSIAIIMTHYQALRGKHSTITTTTTTTTTITIAITTTTTNLLKVS